MKNINICGIRHSIDYVVDEFENNEMLGQIRYKDAKIQINQACCDEIQKATLCHEIMHGILLHIGRDDLSNDEAFVTAIGNAVNESFKPNVYEVKE